LHLKNTINSAAQEKDEIESKLFALQSSYAAMLDGLTAVNASLELQVEELSQISKTQEAVLQDVTGRHQAVLDETEWLRWNRMAGEDQITSLQCSLDNHKRQLMDLLSLKAGLEQKLSQISEEAASAAATQQARRSQDAERIAGLVETIGQLTCEKHELEERLEQTRSEFDQETQYLRESVSHLEREKLMYLNSEAQLGSALKRKQADHQSLQQTASKVRACLDSCTEHLGSIKKQLSFKSAEVDQKNER